MLISLQSSHIAIRLAMITTTTTKSFLRDLDYSPIHIGALRLPCVAYFNFNRFCCLVKFPIEKKEEAYL